MVNPVLFFSSVTVGLDRGAPWKGGHALDHFNPSLSRLWTFSQIVIDQMARQTPIPTEVQVAKLAKCVANP
jgi:hypothetical protein